MTNNNDNAWGQLIEEPINNGKKIGKNEQVLDDDINDVKYYGSFDDMNLKELLLRGIYSYGFECPSKIQQCCISLIASGKDLVAQSQAGTGKTGAFVSGMLQVIDEKNNTLQGIIMAHTRELSAQIESVVKDLGNYMKIKTVLCTGGISVDVNVKEIKNAQILIGTPGRIFDLMERKIIDGKKIKIFIMDEADVMLDREFVSQSRKIIEKLHSTTQICLFSATLPPDVVELTRNFLNNPTEILIKREKLSLDQIHQYYVDVMEDKYKLDVLEDVYKSLSIGQCIIYVNHKEKAKWLKDQLNDHGHSVEAIQSDLNALERTNIMKLFRGGHCRVLISTDLLARGIDVQQVGYVINYDIPYNSDCYLHRIGRSGRYGKKGVAINFVTRRDNQQLKKIQENFKIKIQQMPELSHINEYLK